MKNSKPLLAPKVVSLAASAVVLPPLIAMVMATAALHLNQSRVFHVNSWQELKNPKSLTQTEPATVAGTAEAAVVSSTAAPKRTALYYNFVANGSKCNLVVIDGTCQRWLLRPTLFAENGTTSSALIQAHAIAATNGGYFTPPSDQSASFVIINGKVVADPRNNSQLVKSHKAKPYLQQIFNRSELRVLKDLNNNLVFQIAQHNAPLAPNCRLLNSLQAGPSLLPSVNARQEAFIRRDPDTGKEVDVIGALGDRPRTACGITPDGHVLLLCVSGRENRDGSRGLSLQGVADLLKMLGCVQAINFDGGHSTTMVVDSCSSSGFTACPATVCSAYPQTRVKSVLLLLPNAKDNSAKGDKAK